MPGIENKGDQKQGHISDVVFSGTAHPPYSSTPPTGLVHFTAGGAWLGFSSKGETWPQNAIHPHRPSAQKMLKTPAEKVH